MTADEGKGPLVSLPNSSFLNFICQMLRLNIPPWGFVPLTRFPGTCRVLWYAVDIASLQFNYIK